MKNTEKKKKSGIILSLIALLMLASALCGAVTLYASEKYAGTEEVLSYYKFDILHSYELRTAFFSVLRLKKAGGIENGNVYAAVKDGEVLRESEKGAYSKLKSLNEAVFVFRNGKAVVMLDGMAGGEQSLGFIGEYFGMEYVYKSKIANATTYVLSGDAEAVCYAAPLYDVKTSFYTHAAEIYAITVAAIAGIALLIVALSAKGKAEAYEKITEKVASHVFFEIKWAFFAAVSFLLLWLIWRYSPGRTVTLTSALSVAALLWFCVFSLRIFIADIKRAGAGAYFKNTFPVWAIRFTGAAFSKKRPFRRLAVSAAAYAVLCIVSFCVAVPGALLGGSVWFGAAGVLLFIASTAGYFIAVTPLINDLEKFTDKLYTLSENGETGGIGLPATSDARPLDLALDNVENACRSNAEKALAEEKTKVELITNVSHDLKTPLTSIISYTELLSGSEGLTEEANDYVQIIKNKEQRLKKLIDDLFELSKAASAKLDADLTEIDLTMLINQQLSYNADATERSTLTFVPNVPDHPLMIKADGAKLHNVIENLINNALKYSLPNTRVYVDLCEENGKAVFGIKNISKDKITTDPERFTERFVRGDESRSEEGSGLGLAIAKTYTEVCGGTFDLTVDGDLFKVVLTFDAVKPGE